MTYEVICPACRGDMNVLVEDTPNIGGSYLVECKTCGGTGLIYEQEYTDTELFI